MWINAQWEGETETWRDPCLDSLLLSLLGYCLVTETGFWLVQGSLCPMIPLLSFLDFSQVLLLLPQKDLLTVRHKRWENSLESNTGKQLVEGKTVYIWLGLHARSWTSRVASARSMVLFDWNSYESNFKADCIFMTWSCFIAVIYSPFHTGITLAWAGHAVTNSQRVRKE